MNWLKIDIHILTLLFKVIVIIGLFTYIVIKANTLSFTHDEGFTYDVIKRYEGINTANHHILNTALMRNSSSFFGNSEFSYRLPSVLSFLLFGIGLILVFNRLKNVLLGIVIFSIIILNPFSIDFFSLARGYSLSLGFMVLSLFFFLSLIQKYDKYTLVKLFFLFAFGTLSMLSNFSTINYYIAVWVIFIAIFLIRIKNTDSSIFERRNLSISILFLLATIPVIYVVNRLIWLKNIGQLYFGEDTFLETIKTFVASYLYDIKYTEYVYITLIYFIVFTLVIGVVTLFLNQKSKINSSLIILFFLIIIGHILENFIFDSKFPKDRTALSLFVIYCMFLYATVSNILQYFNFKKKKGYGFIVIPIVALILFHFNNTISYNKTFSWDYDADNKSLALKLNEIAKTEKITLSTDAIHRPGINYYIHSQNLNIERIPKHGVNKSSDYIYASVIEYDSNQYKLVESFPLSKSILLKKIK